MSAPHNNNPLVTVLTPVYNGEEFLAQCIESVINQTYPHWEFIIVNNCSTDDTLKIAQRYVDTEPRIRICNNIEFVDAIENHNIAFRQVSSESKYCKILQADDWLFPRFLETTVAVGEQHPSCGIIGGYVLWGDDVASDGIPYDTAFMPGRELCRQTLLQKIYPFPNISNLMFRAEAIRDREPYFRESKIHADLESYYEILQKWDFGFVHEVLSFVRIHETSRSSTLAKPLNTYRLADLDLLVRFGPVFLTDEEFRGRLREAIESHYRFLAAALFRKHDARFWEFQENGLRDVGYPLSKPKLWLVWSFSFLIRILRKASSSIPYP